MKEPMNLKRLPEYLKKLKQNNEFDENLVVDMGNITIENSKPRISKNFAYLSIILFLFIGTSAGVYSVSVNSYSGTTIVLDASNYSAEDISKIISENGANVVSIKQNDEKSYEVKLNKLKDLDSFLNKLRKNKELKKVEVKK